MRILIVVEDYPSTRPNHKPMFYVHTRVLAYQEFGVEVDVLSFQAKQDYKYEGVKVLAPNSFGAKTRVANYDVIAAHAPNIRHHIFFLWRCKKYIKKLFLFFHGHEAVNINKVYPPSYPFLIKSRFKRALQFLYDPLKLFMLRLFINYMCNKVSMRLVFVSNHMRDLFQKYVKPNNGWEQISSVIPNAAGAIFYRSSYNYNEPHKRADFITVRAFDRSEACVDLLVEIAKNNTDLSFDLYGQGAFFSYNLAPPNLRIYYKTMNHNEIAELLNCYPCALMPTRHDSHGLMATEMALYGIPLVTSDIPICREVFADFENVCFVQNTPKLDLHSIIPKLRSSSTKSKKYDIKHTALSELKFMALV